MGDEFVEVRLPAAEVVVDVEGGNAGGPAAPLEGIDLCAATSAVRQEQFAAGELHVINDVDQQQSDFRILRYATMQVRVLCGHANKHKPAVADEIRKKPAAQSSLSQLRLQ